MSYIIPLTSSSRGRYNYQIYLTQNRSRLIQWTNPINPGIPDPNPTDGFSGWSASNVSNTSAIDEGADLIELVVDPDREPKDADSAHMCLK